MTAEEVIIEKLKKNRWIPNHEKWDEELCREFAEFIDWYVIETFNRKYFSKDFQREMMERKKIAFKR